MTCFDQGSQEWLDMRKNYIGASDASSIMGVGFKTPYQLWQDKLDLAPPQEDNWAMKRGRELEPVAREAYQVFTGNFVDPCVIFHPRVKFMMASLDGLSTCKKHSVEIKVPGEKDHQLAKEGKIPEKYYPQLQQQIAIEFEKFGLDHTHYWSYRNGEGVLVEVGIDLEYIKNMIEELRKFWSFVETFTPPPLLESDYQERHDSEWYETTDERILIAKERKDLDIRDEENKKTLISLADGVNCMGNGVKIQSYIRKGHIDYSSIPALKDIDQEKYRKNSTKSWRISVS